MDCAVDRHLEIIGAFFDGERVDAVTLNAALATEEGRAYLIELGAVRELVAMPAIVQARTTAPGSWSPRFLLAAAGVMLAVGAGGFVLGSSRVSTQTISASSLAPAPTKVLKLESGVNWKDSESSKGGN